MRQVERDMGSGGFFLTYFAAGIFGYDFVYFMIHLTEIAI